MADIAARHPDARLLVSGDPAPLAQPLSDGRWPFDSIKPVPSKSGDVETIRSMRQERLNSITGKQ